MVPASFNLTGQASARTRFHLAFERLRSLSDQRVRDGTYYQTVTLRPSGNLTEVPPPRLYFIAHPWLVEVGISPSPISVMSYGNGSTIPGECGTPDVY